MIPTCTGRHGLKPPISSTPCLAQAGSPYKQHALKGQKLIAQGNALGYHERKPVAL